MNQRNLHLEAVQGNKQPQDVIGALEDPEDPQIPHHSLHSGILQTTCWCRSVLCFWLGAQTALCVSLWWKHAQHTSHGDMKPTVEMCTAGWSMRLMFHNFRYIKEVKTITAKPQHYRESVRLQIFMNCSRFFPPNARAWICNNAATTDVAAFMCFFHNPINFPLHCEGGSAAHTLYRLLKAQHRFCCCDFSFSSASVLCERFFRKH